MRPLFRLSLLPLLAAAAALSAPVSQPEALRQRIWSAALQHISAEPPGPLRDTLIGVVAEQLAARGQLDSALSLVKRTARPEQMVHLLVTERIRAGDAPGVVWLIDGAADSRMRAQMIGALTSRSRRPDVLAQVAATLQPLEGIRVLVDAGRMTPNDSVARELVAPTMRRLALGDSSSSRWVSLWTAAIPMAELGDLDVLRAMEAASERRWMDVVSEMISKAGAVLRRADDPRADSLFTRARELCTGLGTRPCLNHYWNNYIPPLSEPAPLRFLSLIAAELPANSLVGDQYLKNLMILHLLKNRATVPRQLIDSLQFNGESAKAASLLYDAIHAITQTSYSRTPEVSAAALDLVETELRRAEEKGDSALLQKARMTGSFAFWQSDSTRAFALQMASSPPGPGMKEAERPFYAVIDTNADSGFAVARAIVDSATRDDLLYSTVDQFLLHDRVDRALTAAELLKSQWLRNRALVEVGAIDLFGGDSTRARSLVRESIAGLTVPRDRYLIAYDLSQMADKLGMMNLLTTWVLQQSGDARTHALTAMLRGFRTVGR